MERSKKNLIVQIIWIVAIGVILWFVYNEFRPNATNPQPEVQRTTIKEKCLAIAEERANKFEEGQKELAESDNPYLAGHEKLIPQLKEQFKNKEYGECMDIWGD